MKYARDFRASARAALAGKWGLAVGVGLLAGLLGGSETTGFSSNIRVDTDTVEQVASNGELSTGVLTVLLLMLPFVLAVGFIFTVIAFSLGSIVSVGYARFNLNLIDGEKASVGDLFSFFPSWWRAILTNLLRNLFIALWTLLFIIPGIIATYNYAMTSYILAENPDMKPMDALRESKDLMYGHRWRFFCMRFSFIGWSMLGVLSLGIGFLWITPYIQAATADFYREIMGNRPVKEPPVEIEEKPEVDF